MWGKRESLAANDKDFSLRSNDSPFDGSAREESEKV